MKMKDKDSSTDISFAVGGMSCASCVRFVEKELGALEGVRYISVNLADGKAYAVTDGTPTWDNLADAVRRAGYTPLEEVPTEDEIEEAARTAARRVLIAWGVALPGMILMILHMAGGHMDWLPMAEVLAGAAVLFGPGRRILKGAWIALTHRHANMDVLVSLGTLAAWSTAVLAMVGAPIRSFGALAPMLLAFHLTGRLLEARLRRQAGADLRALLSAGGGLSRLVHQDGSILEVPTESVDLGARVRILTGESIPLDGRVVKGGGAVGEAMITGEPVPATRKVGDEVIGGTILERGTLDIEVTRIGEDAFLSRMLALVEQAQGVQIPLQALADRISGIFVPIVFALSLITFGMWAVFYPQLAPLLENAAQLLPWVPVDAGPWTTAVFAMVSVLVVACPCALGLATPMAISVGSGLAARRGLLIKGGEALQLAGKLDLILFDKTGTLTQGHPEVVESDLQPQDIAAAGALEAMSVHPLARAVSDWASRTSSDLLPGVEEVNEIAGEGIEGLVHGEKYFIGRPAEPIQGADHRTVIELRKNGSAVGRIVLSDPIKSESPAVVAELKARGLRPVMITGDAPSAALGVADYVGIPAEDVHASLRPEDKLRIVQEFQHGGRRVAMIGDGINDAAGLKAADVGFALAEGTDLSIEAGDVVITQGGLNRIGEAVDLSSLMVRTIKGNLFWAFAYNLAALPAASLALVQPLIAEAAMTLSSLFVVFNSIRIKNRYRRILRRSETKKKNMHGWSKEMTKYEIEITGMSCGHCVRSVETALNPFSDALQVDLDDKLATIESDSPLENLLAALDKAGYPGKLRT